MAPFSFSTHESFPAHLVLLAGDSGASLSSRGIVGDFSPALGSFHPSWNTSFTPCIAAASATVMKLSPAQPSVASVYSSPSLVTSVFESSIPSHDVLGNTILQPFLSSHRSFVSTTLSGPSAPLLAPARLSVSPTFPLTSVENDDVRRRLSHLFAAAVTTPSNGAASTVPFRFDSASCNAPDIEASSSFKTGARVSKCDGAPSIRWLDEFRHRKRILGTTIGTTPVGVSQI